MKFSSNFLTFVLGVLTLVTASPSAPRNSTVWQYYRETRRRGRNPSESNVVCREGLVEREADETKLGGWMEHRNGCSWPFWAILISLSKSEILVS
ncbi:hypothetical protein DFH06DRAFT_1288794, partial [Mycena polygramma]